MRRLNSDLSAIRKGLLRDATPLVLNRAEQRFDEV
jgi:hypothetical protein